MTTHEPGTGPPMTDVPMPIDRLIHEPARLYLMTLLYVVDEADFAYLGDRTGMTAGNLSTHVARLEEAGYVTVEKTFVGRRPRSIYRMTDAGRRALVSYRQHIDDVLADVDPSS